MSKLSALKKILGVGAAKSKSFGSRVGDETGNMLRGLGDAGKGVAKSGRLAMLENGAKTLPGNLKIDAGNLGGVIKRNPYGAGVVGAGALGAGTAGAVGINELLEELGMLEDEEDSYRRR